MTAPKPEDVEPCPKCGRAVYIMAGVGEFNVDDRKLHRPACAPKPEDGAASEWATVLAWHLFGYESDEAKPVNEYIIAPVLVAAKALDAARAEAIRECIKALDDGHAEYSQFSGLMYEYGRWAITDMRDRVRKLLATPAREKDGGE